jgi:HEPN domain-containing protein
MAIDPELITETRAWFAKASNDLRAAEALTATSPPLFDEALFHCQQAAEKALKGFLTSNGCTFRKTHSLEEIGGQCLAIDPSLRTVIDQAVPLGEYAWKFRYPGGPPQAAPDEVAEALANARGVFEAAVSRLPFDARPWRGDAG